MTAAAPASGVGRASTLLAAGTMLSRVLGFASAAVLTITLGQNSAGGNAFALANQLPNNIYAIIAGGLLSSVFVPAIVRAGLHDDGGQRFVNRLVTLGIVVFVAAGIIATACAPLLIHLYASIGSGGSPQFIALATAFAYWCLPQVLFYALYSLFGEVLNARGVFGPFTWAPAINNVIVVVGLVAFVLIYHDAGTKAAGTWTFGMIALIGGVATLGVAAQAFLLVFFWRRAGLTFRPDFHWRGSGLGSAGRAAAWTFGMILVTQLAGIVQSNVVGVAAQSGQGDAAYVVVRNAWLIFMLPHSIAAVSIATAYFTRMTTHFRDGRMTNLRADFSAALRAIGLIIVFAEVGLIVLAYPFSAVFARHGWADVSSMAPVLIAFLAGLVPFSILHVLRRTFYAVGDTRTPFFVTVFQSILFVVGALLVLRFASTPTISLGIAIVTSVAGLAQTIAAAVILRRRIGSLDGANVLRRHVQFAVAAIPAAVLGVLIVAVLGGFRDGGFAVSNQFAGILTMIVAGGVMALGYGVVLKVMHNPEFEAFIGPILRRIPGRANKA